MSSDLTPVPGDLEIDATIQGLNSSQRIFDRYILRRILGRGGMGIVWLGHDERLDRDVALKFLPEAVNFDPVARDDLMRETRRCLDLTHPKIIRIYDFANDKQAAAISMEYIDGKTLAALRIEKEKRIFEVEEIESWITKTCEALQYAHEEVSVVHRDLKPANLMLTSRGQVKIADFGISRSVSDTVNRITLRSGTSGTLAYMSPQQMNGDQPRVTDDVYALGATIYELLTSRPPFYSGDLSFQVRLMVPKSMKARRKELDISGADIPQEWEDVVAACLAKIPDERPPSISEIAERLGLSGATFKALAKHKLTVGDQAKDRVRRLWEQRMVSAWFYLRGISLRRWAHWGGSFVTVGLAAWVLWHYFVWPFVAVPGDLEVSSTPPGAIVKVSGRTDQPTPAVFPSLRIGRYAVSISADGFDPVQQVITITEGTKVNLGTVALKRADGKLLLATWPYHARYSLNGTANTGGFEKDGSTPDFLPSLPSGTYQLTLTQPGLPRYTETLIVPPHKTTQTSRDLINLTLSNDASPELAKAFAGDLDPGKLDVSDRAQFIQGHLKAFQRYLNAGLLAEASAQLDKLKDLGTDISSYQKTFSDKRAAVEKEFAEQVHDLLSDKKFATAAERLKNSKNTMEPESVNRLSALISPLLASYQKQIASELAISGSLESRYEQLKTISARHSDDLQPLLALAQLEEQMPPDRDRLTARMKSFRQFAIQNSDFATEPAFISMQGAFNDELEQFNALADALSLAKHGPPDVQEALSDLEAQKASLNRQRVGESRSNPFSDTVNFFGKAVTGHSVVNTESGFSSQREKDQAIAAVQSRIDVEQQKSVQPQEKIEDLQNQYDAFVARVPWGTVAGY